MTDEFAPLVADLEAEHESLDALLAPGALDLPTPAVGWTVRDQISHLAWFDERAVEAMTDPEAWRAGAEALIAGLPESMEIPIRRGRALAPEAVVEWWRGARRGLVAAAHDLDPDTRFPWYGPDMGARSFLTARLMEAWAHGQDVADALGVDREPSQRLRHIAHLGVATRGWSYRSRSLEVPATSVSVTLRAPGGDRWEWVAGEGDPGGTIEGTALDFCLVVTQRRHLQDTTLRVAGEAAAGWMEVAQAFAGPPTAGRAPRLHRS